MVAHQSKPLHVGVLDRPSAWRLGIAAALESARFAVTVSDEVSFLEHVDVIVAVIDVAPGKVAALAGEVADGVAIVAVLTDPTVHNYVAALRAGAHGIAGCDASPAWLTSVVAGASRGSVVMPLDVARAVVRVQPLMVFGSQIDRTATGRAEWSSAGEPERTVR